MADWSTVASKKAVPTKPSTVQAGNGSTWANAAGRKAGSGNVSQISRAPVQSKDKNSRKQTAPAADPVAAQQAAMRAIAKEALEHAMDSRGEPSNLGRRSQTRVR